MEQEHPWTAWAGIAAIAMTGLVILYAYFELNGTQELEIALAEGPPISAGAPLDASLQSWVTGFH